MHDKYAYEAGQMALHDTNVERLMAFGVAGFSVAVDSLSAIKYAKVKPIRNENGITTDFEVIGDYPKYGNDNDDVDKIFNISRFIFDEKYDKITDIFKEENISSELAMVIGCITESQKLINDAVNAQQEGGNVNMCKALEKLEEKGRQEGELKTKLKLIIKKIHKNKSFDQIVDELEEDSDVVQPLYDFVLKHIDLGEDEMVQKYLENIE